MKIKITATLATAIVIVMGVAIISPLFFIPTPQNQKQKIMLSFSITNPSQSTQRCQNLSSILNHYNIGATIFIVGKIAQQNPQTVLVFSQTVDIGSRTYDNVNLTNITDYSLKLQEVIQGKTAIDTAGHLTSNVFQAPYDATDQDIYSLLTRANITADFSYSSQYNVYQNHQFIKISAKTYEAQNYPPSFFLNQPPTDQPIIITFNNAIPTSSIAAYIDKLITGNFEFVNASELTGLALTLRGT